MQIFKSTWFKSIFTILVVILSIRGAFALVNDVQHYYKTVMAFTTETKTVKNQTNSKLKKPSDSKNLKTPSETLDDSSTFFSLGSTQDNVTEIMGTPDDQQQYGNVTDFNYGNSYVEFDENGKVDGWSNVDGNLKVTMGTMEENANPVTDGSTQSQVVAALGTPDKITHSGALWNYGDSTVEFENGVVYKYSKIGDNSTTNSTSDNNDSSNIDSSSSSTESIKILDLSNIVVPGQYAYLTAQVNPGSTATIEVIYKSGPSRAEGLIPEIADDSGQVTWRWKVGTRTAYGNYQIIITSDGQSTTTTFTVQ